MRPASLPLMVPVVHGRCWEDSMSETTLSPQDRAKRAAATRAIDLYVRPGMKLGLGSGSTAFWMVRVLGERVGDGLDVVGVPTSRGTADLAREVGVPLADLDDLGELDLTLDGADEIDPALRMIKGGGACLLWEKIVAASSRRMVALVDEGKRVDRLGAYPLPVEVVRFGWTTTRRRIERVLAEHGLAGRPVTLRGSAADPLITDSGHLILDLALGAIADPDALDRALNQIPGVVENGLFCGIASAMVVGYPDGTAKEIGAVA
jgi:ribose 5-phosphate isomerase A